jgi:hypothetical protein
MHRVFPPSEPPDGGRPQSFRLVVGGTQLRGSWYLSAIVRLQEFSSCSPAASPRRWSPKTATTSLWVGRSKPGCDLGPALSFEDVHHPCWGGDRAELELYLPHGFVGQPPPFSIQGRGRSLALRAGRTSTTWGWSTVGVASSSMLSLSAWLPVPPPAARVVVTPCARVDRPRYRAPLERRSCSGVVPPLQRYGASARRSVLRSSGRIRVGICRWADAPVVGAEADMAREVPIVDGITSTICAPGLRLFVLVLAPRASARARARLQRLRPEAIAAAVGTEPEFRLYWHLECRCSIHCGC